MAATWNKNPFFDDLAALDPIETGFVDRHPFSGKPAAGSSRIATATVRFNSTTGDGSTRASRSCSMTICTQSVTKPIEQIRRSLDAVPFKDVFEGIQPFARFLRVGIVHSWSLGDASFISEELEA